MNQQLETFETETVCDRCLGDIAGSYSIANGEIVATRGFLSLDSDFWRSLVQADELVLCTDCTADDPVLRRFLSPGDIPKA